MSTAVRRSARKARRVRQDIARTLYVLAAFAAVGVARWVNEHRALAITASVLLAVGAAVAATRWRRVRVVRDLKISTYHRMDSEQFEHALADLCRRDGCTRVEVVGGGGDLAADVLATLPGRRWWQVWRPRRRRLLIQAKRYAPGNKVSSEHVQMVNGTYRDIHRCQHAAIVTTSDFTRDARALAEQLGIRLYAEPDLAAWAAGGRPPWK
jgi:restriction system protein